MKIIQRYFTTEIVKAVLFVLAAFLALFAFFDLVADLPQLGIGEYRIQNAFIWVLLNFPGYIYELMPVAVLIGTIYVLATFASRSEFTIMRASSLSTLQAAGILLKIGLIFFIGTFIFGELIAPHTSTMATNYRNAKFGRGLKVKNEFRSGVWSKDTLRSAGMTGEVTGARFINIKSISFDHEIRDIHIYEFDSSQQLRKMIHAESGVYLGNNEWRLSNAVTESLGLPGRPDESRFPDSAPELKRTLHESITLLTELTPDIISVLSIDPTKMSAYDLTVFNRHLEANQQDATAYRIAFWKKIIYPFSVFVMMALALPFAYLHFRSGGISIKIFTGIMIGVLFMLLNSLFSHLGMLNTWPPLFTAILPSLFFLFAAFAVLWWVERR